MVERDDGEDFVAELLEEWYAGVERIIHDNYIQQQLIPYTISQSKDAILQMIEVSLLYFVLLSVLKFGLMLFDSSSMSEITSHDKSTTTYHLNIY